MKEFDLRNIKNYETPDNYYKEEKKLNDTLSDSEHLNYSSPDMMSHSLQMNQSPISSAASSPVDINDRPYSPPIETPSISSATSTTSISSIKSASTSSRGKNGEKTRRTPTKSPCQRSLVSKIHMSQLMKFDQDGGDFDLSRSPSHDIDPRPGSLIRKRDSSVNSQNSGTSSGSKMIDCKDNINLLLSKKEVIPQRKRRDFIPNELKDDHYWERRRKNNLAAKRSREKRRLNDMVLETKVLELTNLNNVFKLKLDICMRKFDISEEDLEKMFEENKHLLVVQKSIDMSEFLGADDSHDNEGSSLSTSSIKTESSKDDCGTHKSDNEGLLLLASASANTNPSCSASITTNSSCTTNGSCGGSSMGDYENEEPIEDENDTDLDNDIKENDDHEPSLPVKRKSLYDEEQTEEDPVITKQRKTPPLENVEQQVDEEKPQPLPSIKSLSPLNTKQNENNLYLMAAAVASISKPESSVKYQSTNLKQPQRNSETNEVKQGDPEILMKSQYPLLYNQLCKTALPVSKPEVTVAQPESNQTILNTLLNRVGNNNNQIESSSQQQMMNTILSELAKKSNPTQASLNNSSSNSDILNKILSSSSSSSIMDKLSYLLTAGQNNLDKDTNRVPAPNSNQQQSSTANSFIEKYKNLINKTSVGLAKQSPPPKPAKNTVNNLLLNISGSQANELEPKLKSRKRHLNNAQEKKNEDSVKLIEAGEVVSEQNYAHNNYYHEMANKYQAPDFNEMISMMLSAQQRYAQQITNPKQANQTHNNQQQQQQQQQRHVNSKNNANVKTQAYNQLLMLHHQQQQIQQAQSIAAAAAAAHAHAQSYNDEQYSSSPNSDSIASIYQQQHMANLAKVDLPTGNCSMNSHLQANNNGSNNLNSTNGDNMPLKLRFKMLQLKTGEVN